MQVSDLDQVLANETRGYAFPWTRGIFQDCLRANHQCYVIQDGEELVGHAILSIAVGEAHLLNVCIRRDRQGRGFGRALVEFMLERARSLKVDMVFLEVRPSNRVASSLYESLGFCEIGLRRNYYPAHTGHEDARILALQLNLNAGN